MLTLITTLLVGCGPRPTTIAFDGDTNPTVHSIDAMPVLAARVLDQNGQPIEPTPALTWTVSPDSVAKLDGSNVVPVADGQATVSAANGEISASYTLTVALPNELAIGGYDAEKKLPIGGTQALTATIKAGGNPVADLKATGWESSDPAIATVADGTVTGVAVGKATITAKYNQVAGMQEVEVVEAAAVAADGAAPAADAAPAAGGTAAGGPGGMMKKGK